MVGGLIKQKQIGAFRQATGQLEPTLLPLRHPLGRSPQRSRLQQPETMQRRGILLPHPGPAQMLPVDPASLPPGLPDRDLLRQPGDPRPTMHPDLPGIGGELPGENREESGLPGTIGAGEHQMLPTGDPQGHRAGHPASHQHLPGAQHRNARWGAQLRPLQGSRRLRDSEPVFLQGLDPPVEGAHHPIGTGGPGPAT